MSIAIRDSGWVIMKMIRSSSRMSIMGTTFGSDATSPRACPVPPAISVLLLFLQIAEQGLLRGGLRDSRHHPHPRTPCGLHRLLDLAELQLVVGLEVEDLVLRPGREYGTQ